MLYLLVFHLVVMFSIRFLNKFVRNDYAKVSFGAAAFPGLNVFFLLFVFLELISYLKIGDIFCNFIDEIESSKIYQKCSDWFDKK